MVDYPVLLIDPKDKKYIILGKEKVCKIKLVEDIDLNMREDFLDLWLTAGFENTFWTLPKSK